MGAVLAVVAGRVVGRRRLELGNTVCRSFWVAPEKLLGDPDAVSVCLCYRIG